MSMLAALRLAVDRPDNPAAPDLGAYAPAAAPAPSFDQLATTIYAQRRAARQARALGMDPGAAAGEPGDLEAEADLSSQAIIARRRRARAAGAA